MKKAGILVTLSLASAIAFSGCAFGNRNLKLVYDKEAVTTPYELSKKVEASIGHFENLHGNEIGCVRNAYGWKTAKVLAKRDPGEWIKEALELELKRAGCTINPESRIKIDGQVNKLYTDVYMKYDSQVNFLIRIHQDGRIIYREAFTGNATSGAFWADAKEYGKASNNALEDALRNAVPKIITKLEEIE